MVEQSGYAVALMLIGAVAAAGIAIRAGLERVGVPAVAGYVVVGLALAAINENTGLLQDAALHGFELLARIGVVILLFRIGLESKLERLVQQLRPAMLIWGGDVLVSASFAFLAVFLLSGYGVIPAVFAAVALSATSVGVSTSVWRDQGALDSREGALLLDVAELDDLSSVFLVSLVVAFAAALGAGASPSTVEIAREGGAILLKLLAFLVVCVAFSRFLERRLTVQAAKFNRRHGAALFAAGTALLIAGGGELLGLSLAVGALFAGLAFSRDPAEKQIDRSVDLLDALFTPFFFIGVGLSVDLSNFGGHVGFTVALLGAAVLGKLLGAGAPASLVTSPAKAALIGASLIPRAEIALIVAGYGLALGEWAMPQPLYDGLVFVSLATVIIAPVVVRAMLPRMGAKPARDQA